MPSRTLAQLYPRQIHGVRHTTSQRRDDCGQPKRETYSDPNPKLRVPTPLSRQPDPPSRRCTRPPRRACPKRQQNTPIPDFRANRPLPPFANPPSVEPELPPPRPSLLGRLRRSIPRRLRSPRSFSGSASCRHQPVIGRPSKSAPALGRRRTGRRCCSAAASPLGSQGFLSTYDLAIRLRFGCEFVYAVAYGSAGWGRRAWCLRSERWFGAHV
jgi:hypothetical protein